MPCGGCDYECLRPGLRCPGITGEQTAVMDAICGGDLVYYVLPNFCGMPCAAYFAFNERSVGYFDLDDAALERYMAVPKRFVVISNGESPVFAEALKQQTNGPLHILYLRSNAYGSRSIHGDLMDNQAAIEALTAFLSQTTS